MADRETSRDLGTAHNAPVTPDPANVHLFDTATGKRLN
mgnify:CR=1 FL=1